jgi:glutathione synthase/RimK-type ligase-like ATP-grasp enzyme
VRMPRVALATCAELPKLDGDEPLLIAALRSLGVDVAPAVWDDPEVDWDSYDLVVVRATWDYARKRHAFLEWVRRVPQILNPPDVLSWNTDKRYLQEVPHAIETTFIAPGESWQPDHTAEFVVKPTVAAGSHDAARYVPEDARRAQAHAASLLSAGRAVMVQPYLHAVDDHGETALVYFDGVYSHAIRKGQMLHQGRGPSNALFVEEQIAPRTPSDAERAVGDEILDALPWPRQELLYARVDVIPGPDGAPRLIELELTEPSLFFTYAPGSAERLARRILRRLESSAAEQGGAERAEPIE